ncbi:MAG: type IV pili twitching motility protein PilT, partial [Thermodesulfobacteriota bacterium]
MRIVKLIQKARECNASDIHIVVGMPPLMRINGDIVATKGDAVTPELSKALAYECLNEEQKRTLEESWQLCFSVVTQETERARVTVYYRGGTPELSIRLSEREVRTRAELRLPEVMDELAR